VIASKVEAKMGTQEGIRCIKAVKWDKEEENEKAAEEKIGQGLEKEKRERKSLFLFSPPPPLCHSRRRGPRLPASAP